MHDFTRALRRGVALLPHAALATFLVGLPLALVWTGLLLRIGGPGCFGLALVAFLPLWLCLAAFCHGATRPVRLWTWMALLSGVTTVLALWARGGWA